MEKPGLQPRLPIDPHDLDRLRGETYSRPIVGHKDSTVKAIHCNAYYTRTMESVHGCLKTICRI